MADDTNKGTILITGANGGLGCALVSRIVSSSELSGYHGIYTVRCGNATTTTTTTTTKRLYPALVSALSQGKGQQKQKHSYEIESLELSRLSSVRSLARRINQRVEEGEIPPLRALILNAGHNDMGREDEEGMTEDGYESAYQVNYLSQWLLTILLLPSMDPRKGRIVVLGSVCHDVEHPMHSVTGYFDDAKYKGGFFPNSSSPEDDVEAIARGTFSPNSSSENKPAAAGGRRYGAAKMCCVMMVGELQRRLDDEKDKKRGDNDDDDDDVQGEEDGKGGGGGGGISIVGVDPGTLSNTGFVRNADWFTRWIVFPVIMGLLARVWRLFQDNPPIRTPDRSARDVLKAAMDGRSSSLGGKYLNGTVMVDVAVEARDPYKRGVVWDKSIEHAGLTDDGL